MEIGERDVVTELDGWIKSWEDVDGSGMKLGGSRMTAHGVAVLREQLRRARNEIVALREMRQPLSVSAVALFDEARQRIRAEALEEAALICDRMDAVWHCAVAIRALKDG